MSDLIIAKKNEVHLTVDAPPHVQQELSDYFTFDVPGAKYMLRNIGIDIGMVRSDCSLLQQEKCMWVYLTRLLFWARKSDYSVEFKNNETYGTPFEENDEISLEGVKDYMTAISSYKPRDYQVQGVFDALKYNRKLIISPTGSGKSLMIYAVARYHVGKKEKNIISCTNHISRRTDVQRLPRLWLGCREVLS